ncbi:MAG: M50 family metallopeptidase [Alphaproteobacteria bacterium]
MARAPKEPTSTLNLPVRSAVALEMMLAGLISLLLVELSRMSGPVGWVFGPIGTWITWFSTFFHEFGHGFFVSISDSTLRDFRLNWDGSGSVTYTIESWRLPITWAGYATPALVGAVLYWEAHGRGLETQGTLVVVALLIGGVALIWPQTDPVPTLSIAGILVVSLLLVALLCASSIGKNLPLDWLQRIIAATLLIEGLQSVWYLLGLGEPSDALTLSELYVLPEIFWVMTWLVWTGLCVGVTYVLEVRDRRRKLLNQPRRAVKKK